MLTIITNLVYSEHYYTKFSIFQFLLNVPVPAPNTTEEFLFASMPLCFKAAALFFFSVASFCKRCASALVLEALAAAFFSNCKLISKYQKIDETH